MTQKMKRDRGDFIFPQNVSRPSNPPDELAQNVSKKIPVGRIIPPFFGKSSESGRFSIVYMIRIRFFVAQGIKSEGVSGGTVFRRSRICSNGLFLCTLGILSKVACDILSVTNVG